MAAFRNVENGRTRTGANAGTGERDTAHAAVDPGRRTGLAADRTLFAAERTYAAWVRTGLVALASGVGARSLLQHVLPGWLTLTTGSVLVLFAAFCFGAAVWRQLYPGLPLSWPNAGRLHPAILLTVNGFLIVIALAVLVGIWFGAARGVSAAVDRYAPPGTPASQTSSGLST